MFMYGFFMKEKFMSNMLAVCALYCPQRRGSREKERRDLKNKVDDFGGT